MRAPPAELPPDPTHGMRIHTARLVLMPCDAIRAAIVAQIAADPRVAEPFYAGRAEPDSLQFNDDHWRHADDDWPRQRRLTLAVCLRDDASATPLACMRFNAEGIAYFVAPRHWRQGYGREMVAASVTRIAPLLGLATLETALIRENIGSRRILEDCGFVFAGLESVARGGGRGKVALLRYRRRVAAPAPA